MINITRPFKALSDKNRIRILMMLSRKPLCVCEITEVLELSASTVSKHLSILKESGFILDEKEGKWVNYKLNIYTTDPMVQQLIMLLPVWSRDEEQLKSDNIKISTIDRNIICNSNPPSYFDINRNKSRKE